MDPEKRRHAANIFANALERSPEARSEFLRDACGEDQELHQEVWTLLRASPEAGDWFARAIGDSLDGKSTQVLPRSTDPTGRIVSHYELEQFLGAGGMGEVYRARDLALGRPAAVKLLRPGVPPQIRNRLVQEARTNARFSHPGIAQFFDAGLSDGVNFLAMEFVDGDTLRQRLRKGPLSVNEALATTASILEALVHAHAAGFLHRDIKPDNVMTATDGVVKLLDFGIAKEIGVEEDVATRVLADEGKDGLTAHGMVLGTPGYMSPEQLRGDPVNERTDAFGVGAILFEMISGERAFPGRNAWERASATLTRDIPSVVGGDVPADLDRILTRALARDPAERYSSASEFLSELRHATTGSTVAMLPNTLAVLDLENLRGDAQDEWIGSGVAESLGVDLRRVERLRLVPREKVLKVRAQLAKQEKANDAVAVGLAAGCRWVLTGSHQRMGSALRLTMRLVEVSTGKEVWTQKLDGNIDDIFAMQDKLAVQTAESLHLVMPEAEASSSPALDAFEHFARARDLFNTWARSDIQQAREHLQKALELDPDYGPALAWMASFHAPARWSQTGDPKDLEAALDLANRAVEVDPQFAEGHLWRGYALWRQGVIDDAIEEFAEAARLDSSTWMPWYFISCCHAERGHWEKSLEAGRAAFARNSKTPMVAQLIVMCLVEMGDFDAAIWMGEKARELETDTDSVGWAGAGAMLASALQRAGRLDEARECAMETLLFIEQKDRFARGPVRSLALVVLAEIALDQGDSEAARVAFDQVVSHLEEDPRGVGAAHLMVQALAGQSRVMNDAAAYERACNLVRGSTEHRFSWGAQASFPYTYFALSQAARALGKDDEAHDLFQQARDAGLRRRE